MTKTYDEEPRPFDMGVLHLGNGFAVCHFITKFSPTLPINKC